ncbi:MAG: hypothetical protein ABI680_06000, partial [Chthoniobacteraceae bacterium]
ADHTDRARNGERAAKIACLRPIAEPRIRTAVLAVAKRTVENGRGETDAPWYQLALGMAEYRDGNYVAAEAALSAAVQTASSLGPIAQARIEGTANFYRAMGLFQQGKRAEARALFTTTEAVMAPLPTDEDTSAIVKSDHDDVILWLACKEARALLAEPATVGR